MVTCRPATPLEIDAVVDVWRAVNVATRGSKHLARLKSWARLPGALLAVAEGRGGALIAMGLALPGRDNDGAGDLIPGLRHLTGICLLPDEQGRGVGGRLVDRLLLEARATGHDRATLWTHTNNRRARKFFESRGFQSTGRVDKDELGDELMHYEAEL